MVSELSKFTQLVLTRELRSFDTADEAALKHCSITASLHHYDLTSSICHVSLLSKSIFHRLAVGDQAQHSLEPSVMVFGNPLPD